MRVHLVMAETCWVNKMIKHGRIIFDVFSSVGIVTGYMLDSWASIPGRARDISLLHSVQPPILVLWVPEECFPGV